MDSWTLQGDSYSFLRSAPRTFSLCHRDGTPNHIEIFDIINTPSQRGAISETTCLCDIFGDDGELSSPSSSPAAGPFVFSGEVDGTTAASPLLDDLNESSGSYHSAQGTSEGEDIFEDSRERLYSPPLQREFSEKRSPEIKDLSSGQAEVTEDSKTTLEQKSKSSLPQLSTAGPPSEVLNSGERSPSPGHNITYTPHPNCTESSSSSSSVVKGCSPISSDLTQVHSGTDLRITPALKEKHTSQPHQPLISSQDSVNKNFSSDCQLSDLENSQSLPDFRGAQVLPEPTGSPYNQQSSCSPKTISEDPNLDLTELSFKSEAICSSPLSLSSSTELLSHSREALVSPDLKNRSYSPDTQESSPFLELRRKVSLPDLFSGGSTPGSDNSTHTPELISGLSTRGDNTTSPDSTNTRLSTVSTPAPRYTPPSPVISIATSSELVESSASPELSDIAHSPAQHTAVFPAKTETRTPSPGPSYTTINTSTASEIQIKVLPPLASPILSLSTEATSNNSPIGNRYSSPSPGITITVSSPEVARKVQPFDVKISASPLLESGFSSSSSRSLTSSPHITGISYSVIQPEDRISPPFPELAHLSTLESYRTQVSSATRSPTPSRDSTTVSTGTPRESPHTLTYTNSVVQPETILSNQPRYQTHSPQPNHHTPSPEPRYQALSSDNYQTPSTQPNHHTPSPEPRYQTLSSDNYQTPSPQSNHHTPSPEPRYQALSSDNYQTPSPQANHHTPSPEPRYQTLSSDNYQTPSPQPNHHTPSPEPRYQTLSFDSYQTPSPEPNYHSPSLEPRYQTLSSDNYQTPSPQTNHHTPSPEPRHQTLSSDNYQSPSPEHSCNNLSPVAPSPEQRYHQKSSTNVSIEKNPDHRPLVISPVFEGEASLVNITEIRGEENIPSLLELNIEDKSIVAEIKGSSVVEVPSPLPSSPYIVGETAVNSPKQQNIAGGGISKDINIQDNSSTAIFSEDKGTICPTLIQKEVTHNKLSAEVENPSPNFLGSADRSQSPSPFHTVSSKFPDHRLENLHPQVISYSVVPDSSSPLKSSEHTRRQTATSARRENREKFTEDMAYHVNRRRTPSPPLTRFTPVHIIAPEKPYRHWQNCSNSAAQVIASSQSDDLSEVVTNRESPNVVSVVNNSQANQVRQLEMEREMQLKEDRKVAREKHIDRGVEREKKREEQLPERVRGWQGDLCYRGEQVELSFNARNRKGPGSRGAASTSREIRQGLPALHSYSESLLATRQLQQQQSPQRFAYQQDTRGGSSGRRLQPPAPQNKKRAPGRLTIHRSCQSSSSSMGSELDEADNEVKWFTDEAFSSLSSPEVDYLDMYNSSQRSSTNISQPSTQESSAGANAAWMAYADFRGSAPKLDNDELSFQQTSLQFSDGLNPSRRFEMGSFECIDVAMEREDSRRVRRGVPKRQIQLKRKDTADSKQDGSSENSSPGMVMMMESPPFESHSKETFVRQHSALQESYSSECSSDCNLPNERKPKLLKSSSLDDTCNKTKKATCFIKNVLSKKMTSVDKDLDEQEGEINQTLEENSSQSENAALGVSPKLDTHNLSSSVQSDYSFSSEGPSVREPSTKDDAKPPIGFGVRSGNRPSSSSSSRSVSFSLTESEEADSQSRNVTSSRSEMISAMKGPFDNEQSCIGVQQADDDKSRNRREAGDSANTTARNMGAPSDTGAKSAQARVTNRDQECENTEGYKQLQQGGKGICRLKTQEITLKAVEKKKTSLNVCLTPEAENKPEASSPDLSSKEMDEKVNTSVDGKTEEVEGNVNNQVKTPIHKVRDVRQLVKNKYNLSFKATGAVMTSTADENRVDNFNAERRQTNKDQNKKETTAAEEMQVIKEIEREERRQDMKEDFRAERKDGQKEEAKDLKLRPISPPPQSKGTLSQPQTMQIEYQAVCWKENKNEMPCTEKDSDNPGDKLQSSLKLARDLKRESDTETAKLGQKDINLAEEHKVPENADNSAIVRTYRKAPMLGNLSRLPSKEREVSTAVVLIRDGSSKTETSAPAALEEVPYPVQGPAASPSPGLTTAGNIHARSGHSVSMLLKEKGYQADIGAVMGDNQNAVGGTGLTCKHVNCLEIPLQTTTTSDGGQIETERERAFSSSSTMSGPSALSDSTDILTKTKGNEGMNDMNALKHTAKQTTVSLLSDRLEQTPNVQKDMGDFEAIKRIDPTFPPKSPAIRRFRPQSIEVKSLSKGMQRKEMPTNSTASMRPQTIEVKSIAKNTQKPAVPPKPSCKFKPADVEAMPNEAQKPPATTSTVKHQGEERSQTIVVSSPTIYRKITNDSTSNYTRKLSVSTISSLKPPPLKTTATTMSNLSHQLTSPPETETSHDRGQQQKTEPQGSSYIHRPTTIETAPISPTGTGLTKNAGPALEPKPYQLPGPMSTGPLQPNQPAVMDPDLQLQHPRIPVTHEPAVLSNNTKPPSVAPTTQVPGYTHQPCRRSLSSDHPHRTDDKRFYGSDDPPSYDERESFSPLMLPDLATRRSNRYQPSSRPPPCSCAAGCPSHPGLILPHHQRSPHSLTPPAPSHSPGQALPYAVAQPPHRPHQCRSDPQQMNYQLCSPKSSPLGPSQPPTIYQPLHQPPPCPPHPSLMQPCPADRLLQPPQHIDSRRPPVHRSPQQQPSGMTPYNDPGRSHSPGLPSVDPQYLCGPQSLGPTYGSEYGGDTSSLYSESSYGQTPRRVLLDPETGKYFYIEVPVQPLRKMLFDPETGQYVEVLIPQQAMSHSALYPPSAAPYPTLHNPNIYAPSPQYMPYAAPPPPPLAQTQPQPPRYPETSAAPTMHPIGAGVSYRNPSGQASKPESLNHPTLDQNYLDSMYYVPTGMTASPNPTPPDYYHKNPPNLPPTGGKRS
ncbi:uncharacterized protein si:ch73-43g23.1 [Antennarius striatus]|uniref:uncharacterized protein si:ch73-43g23.1 n=1 Tax=Antennarius striatus TaxID=241820 RepID=UPI0035B49901